MFALFLFTVSSFGGYGVVIWFLAFNSSLLAAPRALQGGHGSGDGLGVLDLDVDMDDVAALKASEICEEGQAEKGKKKNDNHFELTNIKDTLQGTLGLRQKKDNSSQLPGGNRAQPSAQAHANLSGTAENSTNSQDKMSSRPQPPSDAAKTD